MPWPALAADDDDIGHRLDAVLNQERRILEPGLRLDVRRDHRLSGLERMALRAVAHGREDHLAHHARSPAHARAHRQRSPVLLQVHDLGEIGSRGIPDQAAGLGQDLVQAIGSQRELPELSQDSLLP